MPSAWGPPGVVVLPPDDDTPAALEARRATLTRVRAWMTERGLSQAAVGRLVGHSASAIGVILRGAWGRAQWPRYFDIFLGEHGLHPDGPWLAFALEIQGRVDPEKTLHTTARDAERRNARFAAERKSVRWVPVPDPSSSGAHRTTDGA